MSILILNSILFYRKSQEQDFKRMTNAVFFLKTQRFRYILLAKKDQKKKKTNKIIYLFSIYSIKNDSLCQDLSLYMYIQKTKP